MKRRAYVQMCICAGAAIVSAAWAHAESVPTRWTIPLTLTCRGVDMARPVCEDLAGKLAFARHRGEQATALDEIRVATQRHDGRRRISGSAAPGAASTASGRSVLLRQVERSMSRGPVTAAGLVDHGFALIADGRWAEALADFLRVVGQAPSLPTPPEGALVAFALLWPSLDDTQRSEGAMQLAGAFGGRLSSIAARGRDVILVAQLYQLAGDPSRARTVLSTALATRPTDTELQTALHQLQQR